MGRQEIRARAGKPLRAHRQGGTDRGIVPALPRGHAVCQSNAVEGHIRVVIRAQFLKPPLAEGTEAQRGPLHAVRENAKVPYDNS